MVQPAFDDVFPDGLAAHYERQRVLGRGGTATVWLAQDLKHGRPVALKILNEDVSHAVGLGRFQREIRITASLQHPNILTLIDSGETNGRCWFAMPFVDGETLRQRLAQTGALSVEESVRIAREVADALGCAHRQGVVHRDIKPENIMLSHGHAVVTDFGIARAIGDAAGPHTVGGFAIGTPAYMSPEQATGSPDVDGRSDLYALGCVLFEMLSGRPPFTGPTHRSVLQQQVTGEAPALRSLRPDLPPLLVALVEKAMARDRAQRFESGEALAEALAPFEAAGDGGSRAGAFWPPAVAGRRWRIAAAAALVLAASVTAFVAGRFGRTGPAAAPSPYRESIAAIPLDGIGDDPQSGVLGEGIVEEIASQLAQVPGLKVVSSTSAAVLKGKGLTTPRIAKALGVRHVLEGSLQRDAGRVRVTLRLVDARTDTIVWSESYDGDLTDVLALRKNIARKVAAALSAGVRGTAAEGLPAPRPRNPAAWEALLEGRYWLERPNRETIRRSLAAFEQSILLDPAFAPAHAGLSSALRQSVQLGYRGDVDPFRDFGRAADMAQRAIDLDPTLASAWSARGTLRVLSSAPTELAVADLHRAFELMPGSASILSAYALGLARAGDYGQALAKFATAAELDPMSPVLHGGGYALTALAARRYDVAEAEARAATALDSRFEMARLGEAFALVLQGRADACLRLDLVPFPEARAMCLHALGRRSEADALVAPLLMSYADGHHDATFHLSLLACYFAFTGDASRTLEWVEKAYAASPTGVDFRFLDSGLFDPVRRSPHFVPEVRRLQSRIVARVFGDPRT